MEFMVSNCFTSQKKIIFSRLLLKSKFRAGLHFPSATRRYRCRRRRGNKIVPAQTIKARELKFWLPGSFGPTVCPA